VGQERETLRVNAEGTLALLQAIREHAPHCRLFYAGSSEMFGEVSVSPQDETTPFHPRNVYGVSKVTGFHLMSVYRSQHGLFACCGILYNHESPRRGNQFVTRKISKAVAQIRSGDLDVLQLGNLNSVRDWGHARDYVRAMWLCLQQECPDDYIIATGRGRSVKEFVEAAFRAAGLEWTSYVRETPEYYRAAEDVPLVGRTDKAQHTLGWSSETSFDDLVSEMVEHDVASYNSTKR
jgi:GDPmannose 4,6-dehydratase